MSRDPTVEQQRQMVEDRLRSELERTRANYFEVREEWRRGLELFRDAGPASPDGGFALQRATSVELRAWREYSQALMEFSRFVTDGEVPARLRPLLGRRLDKPGES